MRYVSESRMQGKGKPPVAELLGGFRVVIMMSCLKAGGARCSSSPVQHPVVPCPFPYVHLSWAFSSSPFSASLIETRGHGGINRAENGGSFCALIVILWFSLMCPLSFTS